MKKQDLPLPDHEWEHLMGIVIDGTYSDDENIDACEAIELLREERSFLINKMPKKRKG